MTGMMVRIDAVRVREEQIYTSCMNGTKGVHAWNEIGGRKGERAWGGLLYGVF